MELGDITFSGAITIAIPIAGFLYWHFKEIHKLKDHIQELKLEMKTLENRDNLQQQTIDQLKELYPVLKTVIDQITFNKK